MATSRVISTLKLSLRLIRFIFICERTEIVTRHDCRDRTDRRRNGQKNCQQLSHRRRCRCVSLNSWWTNREKRLRSWKSKVIQSLRQQMFVFCLREISLFNQRRRVIFSITNYYYCTINSPTKCQLQDEIMWRHEDDDIRQPFTDDKFRTIRQNKVSKISPKYQNNKSRFHFSFFLLFTAVLWHSMATLFTPSARQVTSHDPVLINFSTFHTFANAKSYSLNYTTRTL